MFSCQTNFLILVEERNIPQNCGTTWHQPFKVLNFGLYTQGRHFNFFLGGQFFLLFFNAIGLLKNWKKQHFICSDLTLFIVPFFLSFFSFFSLFSFFLFFFLPSFPSPTAPSNDAPVYTVSCSLILFAILPQLFCSTSHVHGESWRTWTIVGAMKTWYTI